MKIGHHHTSSQPQRGLPIPGLGRFHRLAWGAWLLSNIGWFLIACVGLVALFETSSTGPITLALALDVTAPSLLCFFLALMIGCHALIKARWPGRTETARQQAPRRRDSVLALGVVVLSLAGVLAAGMLVTWSLSAG